MNFCILGAGAFGTSIAIHLNSIGHIVTLVPRRMEHALDITSDRENKVYLPGVKLDINLQISGEIKPSIMEADVIILACPSYGLKALCEQIQPHLRSSWGIKLFIVLSKGLEENSLNLPCQVVENCFPDYPVAILSGPSYALEIATGKPAAMVLAEKTGNPIINTVQTAFSNQVVRVYTSSDTTGVGLGSCLKNVYAIASGICDGLELGDNAKSALITRSITEMVTIGKTLGGQVETFYGLSGFGDLIATCNGKWSRNRTLGEKIAKGQSASDIIANQNTSVEGYKATKCFHQLMEKNKLDAPILNEIYEVLYNGKEPKAALESLMIRNLKEE